MDLSAGCLTVLLVSTRPAHVSFAVLVVIAVALTIVSYRERPANQVSASPVRAVQFHSGSGPGIHAIKHVVMIMQENRSFDSYFGTFPGADGFRMRNGRPVGCERVRP